MINCRRLCESDSIADLFAGKSDEHFYAKITINICFLYRESEFYTFLVDMKLIFIIKQSKTEYYDLNNGPSCFIKNSYSPHGQG